MAVNIGHGALLAQSYTNLKNSTRQRISFLGTKKNLGIKLLRSLGLL